MHKLKREMTNGLLIFAGILLAAVGLKSFLLASHFIDGGVTGVSMLLAAASPLPLSLWLPLVNAPFILLAYRNLGPGFATRSLLSICGLSLAIFLIPFPAVTSDHLLSAVFGGFFIGAGIGLTIRGGAVLDGTEIAALLISRRQHLLKVGDIILGCNILIFAAAILILGVEPALYSILTYLTASRMLDFVLYGIEQFTAIMIVSEKSTEIRKKVTEDLGRGVTILRGYGGLTGQDRDVIYCVVTRLEIGRVKEIVEELDERAFVTIHPLATASGGVIKRARHL